MPDGVDAGKVRSTMQKRRSGDELSAEEQDGGIRIANVKAGLTDLDGIVPEIDERQQIKYGNRNLNVTILGTTPNYPDVHRFEVDVGRMFNEADDSARRRVAVLASEIPGMLDTDAASIVGRKLQTRSISFDVIGVLKPKGSSGWRNPDDDIWIPLSTAQFRVAGNDLVETISAKVSDGVPIELAMVDIERVLRREHGIYIQRGRRARFRYVAGQTCGKS